MPPEGRQNQVPYGAPVRKPALQVQRQQKLLLYAGVSLAALALLFFLLGTLRRRKRIKAQPDTLPALPDEPPKEEADAALPEAAAEEHASQTEYVENMCLHPAEDSRIIEAAIKETAGAPSQDVDSPRDPAQENGGTSHD